ncbi:formyl-CoA transferase [Sulfodiicoccus acidiphilus]|uniref:Formyl-CoA transferase n=1 Tax=Sulfodiicoccus acidiphilus TaxID=1670455 RepID=A0A348B610_9CREN|nr:CoA transferase [Sulfodiicoccus acidiphilus]BBD73612.1 formyl-CoA transferase [Sulfodiicoccus acidiphilus]GGU04748.1 formyl-CoA transferase [Sulfodiicoccus acidiphilus]
MRPLDGIRVVEMGVFWNGPYTSRLLAELGAEVIKVEPPWGDPQRYVPPIIDGISLHFMSYNANKKFITLNVKKERGKELLLKLVEKADVFIENYSPGTVEKLGIGYEEQSKVNPKIIYVSTTGYGRTGPYSALPGFDPTVEAMSGFMDTNGFPDKPTRVGMGILDIMTPAYAAVAILAALRLREFTGKGTRIDMSMFDVAVLASQQSMIYFLGGFPHRVGPTGMFFYPEYLYKTKDGMVYVIIHNDEAWRRLCEHFGRPDMARDPRFSTNQARLAAWRKLVETIGDPDKLLELKFSDDGDPLLKAGIELHRTVSSWFLSIGSEEVMRIVNSVGGAAGVMRSLKEQLTDPHVLARRMWLDLNTPSGAAVKIPGSAFKIEASEGAVVSPGLPLGYNNAEVYRSVLGLSTMEIEKLKEDGII